MKHDCFPWITLRKLRYYFFHGTLPSIIQIIKISNKVFIKYFHSEVIKQCCTIIFEPQIMLQIKREHSVYPVLTNFGHTDTETSKTNHASNIIYTTFPEYFIIAVQ